MGLLEEGWHGLECKTYKSQLVAKVYTLKLKELIIIQPFLLVAMIKSIINSINKLSKGSRKININLSVYAP